GMNLNGAKIPGTDFNISNVSLLGTNDINLSPVLTCNPSAGLGKNQFINPSCFSIPTAIGQNGPTVLPAIYGPAFFNTDLGLFKRRPPFALHGGNIDQMRSVLSGVLISAFSLWGQTAPSSFDTLAHQAEAARNARQLEKALALYQQALKLKPDWDDGLWNVGS